MPFFFVKTPEEFLEFLRLTIPQPASGLVDPQALTGWFSTHPNAYNAFVLLNEIGVDESYGGLAYNSLHAFHYANADGKTSVARFAWIPDQPTPRRPHNSDTSAWQPDYLRREIVSRVTAGCGPGFTLVATLQGPGDEEDNSSLTWNSTETRTLGRLQLGALVRDQYWDCEALRFNPARLIDGIDLSSDPILLARKDAYDVSADRRTAAYPPRD